MDAIISPAHALQGTLSLPPDKAICHRVVLAAAIADGDTEIRPWPAADDCQRTLDLVEALGVSVRKSPQAVWIGGRGLERLRAPVGDLHCGESGTTLRLAAGLLAGQPFASRLSAGPGLRRRPMRRIAEPLSRMGARLEGAEASSGELHPPLTLQGRRPLAAIRYESPVASAQVKSAVLLAGLFADGPTTVVEPIPTRDHTERALRRFGVRVDLRGREITVHPQPLRAPGRLLLPGDPSSAAFFLVAASCAAGSTLALEDVGLNPTRIGFLHTLRRMGGSVDWRAVDDGWEPRGRMTVEARRLRGVAVEAREVPGLIDELPALLVAAACADGRSRFTGVGELRVKETDRMRSMVAGLTRLGARIRIIEPDTIEVDGGPLTGAVVESAGDHRTAMSLAVAGLAAQGVTTIRGVECVAKSFPQFFALLGRAAGSSTVKTVDNT